jgi:hypothetical protein
VGSRFHLRYNTDTDTDTNSYTYTNTDANSDTKLHLQHVVDGCELHPRHDRKIPCEREFLQIGERWHEWQ